MEQIIIQAEPTVKEVNQAYFEHRYNTILTGTVVVVFVLTLISALYGTVSLCAALQITGPLVNYLLLASLIVPIMSSVGFVKLERNIDVTGGEEPLTVQYVFNEKGVQLADERDTFFIPWSDIERAYDCVNSLAFAVKSVVFVLPKRNFKDGKELKKTRQLLKDKIANFTYARGNRPDVLFENTFENSGATIFGAQEGSDGASNSVQSVESSLASPRGAKVKLSCVYYSSELSEFQWRYVNRQHAIIRMMIRCLITYLLLRFSLWICDIAFGIPDLLVLLVVALGGFGYFQFLKLQRFLTIPAIYGGRLNAYFEVGNDLVLFRMKGLKDSISWNDITEIHETTRFFILKTRKILLLIIPKRALKNEYKNIFVTNLLRRKKEGISKAKNVKAS